ncbi:MAG: IPT/TIG domain-containing protein [Micropruina sp.]|uniref:IPT/TIG domain-containing protein n=1 Tax=Micropruina sp. TaxID=2737536 RepID=UPI0039E53A67
MVITLASSGTSVAWAEPDPTSPLNRSTVATSEPVAPVVSGIIPARGPLVGKTVVTVTGTGFTGASKVLFGDKPGSQVTVVSDTKLTVVAPPGWTTVDVRVFTKTGTSAVSAAAKYRYVAPPRVVRVYPDAARIGKTVRVVIAGANFVDVTKVMFGNSTGKDIRVTSENQIIVTAPARYKPGTVDVQVITEHGISAANTAAQFSAIPAPWLSWLSPASGPAAGGNTITIYGSSFVKPFWVSFGGKAGTNMKVLSDKKMTVTVPAGKPGTTVNVAVVTPYGYTTNHRNTHYTYKAATTPAPTITSVAPTTGPATGGTTLTITGTNLTGTSKVTVGGSPATNIKVVSATTVTALTPAHTAGPVDITLTTPAGTTTTTKAFTYAACTPTVINITVPITEDTTWQPSDCGTVYYVAGWLAIKKKATLTVAAGTVVKFNDNASATVDGSLIVNGTTAKPVTFTSIHDDTIGGDTNNNGNATTPKPGNWSGIYVGEIRTEVNGVPVDEMAGYTGAVLRVNALVQSYSGGIQSRPGNQNPDYPRATVRVTNSHLSHNSGGYAGGSIAVFDHSAPGVPGEITITGNTLESSGGIFVDSPGAADGSWPVVVRDNKVTGDEDDSPAIFVRGERLQPSQYAANIATGNRVNAIGIGGTLVEDWTIPTTGLPFIVEDLKVAKGVTLTAPAGSVLKFRQYATHIREWTDAYVEVEGSLVANGPASNPAIFTSLRDDTIGGDTNGDGNATTPAVGDWKGVSVLAGGTINAPSLVIRYAP